jgi:hypothetical protein
LVDTLRVEPPPFLHTSFYVDGRSDSGAGLLSHAHPLQLEVLAVRHPLNVLRRSVKRAKLTAADRFLWGLAVAVLDQLAVCPGDRETGDGDRLAP